MDGSDDHYRRYDLVIHMESAAVRVPEAYLRYPQAHRPEDRQSAARLDALLGELWGGRPRHIKIKGTTDIKQKIGEAIHLLTQYPALVGSAPVVEYSF